MAKLVENTPNIWLPPTLGEWIVSVEDCGRWIIQDIVPLDGKILCSGQKKRACKSYTTFIIALAITTGKTNTSILTPETQIVGKPVVCIQEESTAGETKERFNAICKGLDLDATKINNLYFAFHDRVKLDNPDWRQKLVVMVKTLKPVLIIFDPFYKLLTGDENKANDVLPVIDTLEELRALGTAVMLVAHLDKNRGEDPTKDIDTQVRGTGTLTDDYDMHIALRRYKMNQESVHLTCRSKGGGDKFYNLSWDFQKLYIESKGYEITDQAKLSMSEINEFDIIYAKALKKLNLFEKYDKSDLREKCKLSLGSVNQIVTKALADGKFKEVNPTTWIYMEK